MNLAPAKFGGWGRPVERDISCGALIPQANDAASVPRTAALVRGSCAAHAVFHPAPVPGLRANDGGIMTPASAASFDPSELALRRTLYGLTI
jgi:hypothetical protein